MIGPKEKRERALGQSLQLKGKRSSSPKAAIIRKPYRPGQHGKKPVRNVSDFARQIKEKQKLKLSYGLDERGLWRIYSQAIKMKGSNIVRLMELLERRVDNIVFRAGLAPSRSAARQLVVHGHIRVNDHIVRSPGYTLATKDVLSIRPESIAEGSFKDLRETLKNYEVPSWLRLDVAKLEVHVVATPETAETPFEVSSVVESFSK